LCVDVITEVDHEEDVKGVKANRDRSPKPPCTAGNVPKRSAKMLNEEAKRALGKLVGFPQMSFRHTDEKQTLIIVWHNKHKGNALNIGTLICSVKLTIRQKIN